MSNLNKFNIAIGILLVIVNPYIGVPLVLIGLIFGVFNDDGK